MSRRNRNRNEVRGNTVVVHGEIPPGYRPPSTSIAPSPPPPAAPRTQLTADEQIRATALWLALVVDDATPEDRVIDQAERYAAYIRGDTTR